MEKTILITCGDPGGIGPEVALRAYLSGEFASGPKMVLLGDRVVIKEAMGLLQSSVPVRVIAAAKEAGLPCEGVNLMDLALLPSFEKRRPTVEGGKASARYVEKAVELIMRKEADALVTAPISKDALKQAGVRFPGHTEMLAHLTGTTDFAMMLCGGPLRVVLATIHTALRAVPDCITANLVLDTIRLAYRAARMLDLENPRIAVAGLNPHAGEGGLFGDEEIHRITPAVKAAKKEGIPVTGPYPPDTVFHKAYLKEVDIVVAMYHDQGLAPLKMIAFDSGVNITLGLPFVRTSPDHGTAYDIAWQGLANPFSMIEAIKAAVSLHVV